MGLDQLEPVFGDLHLGIHGRLVERLAERSDQVIVEGAALAAQFVGDAVDAGDMLGVAVLGPAADLERGQRVGHRRDVALGPIGIVAHQALDPLLRGVDDQGIEMNRLPRRRTELLPNPVVGPEIDGAGVLAQGPDVRFGLDDLDLGLLGLAALLAGAEIGAPPVRSEIAGREDVLARRVHHRENAVGDRTRRKRFGHELGDPGIARLLDHELIGGARDHDEGHETVRNIPVGPDPVQEQVPVDAVHQVIGNDQIDGADAGGDGIGLAQLQPLDRGRAIRLAHGVLDSEGFDGVGQEVAHEGVVVHHHHADLVPVQLARHHVENLPCDPSLGLPIRSADARACGRAGRGENQSPFFAGYGLREG